ncbi:MAG: hypothetical protein IPM45_00725 [Acidimicrobiales bacterium]|nr:hypothetical protein [Acidimicrobiales bacterium]
MLNPLDDYPVHQTPQPIAHPATGDLNAYDRYFFNGYDPDRGFMYGLAMGLYPNRHVIDAAFSVVHDGVQTSVFASGLAPDDRTRTHVGPIAVQVVEPLRVIRLLVRSPEHGLEAELEFRARTPALEEPRFTLRQGTRTVFDYTRLTQWGTWDGWVRIQGRGEPVSGLLGSRDRSWGIRPVGERVPGAPGPTPQFFWLWAPLHFDDACLHADVQEYADGRRWHEFAAIAPLLEHPDEPAFDPAGRIEAMRTLEHRITWRPGTRRAAAAELVLVPWGGEHEVVELTPVLDFQMLGIGYLHPDWGHGHWKGEAAVGGDSWVLAELDPLAPQHVHVQQLCRARWRGRDGVGVLEQLVIGPHEASGFGSLFDGAP